MSHLDPQILALRALGEQAGTPDDDAHLAGCAQCQGELEQFSGVTNRARADGRPATLLSPPSGIWTAIVRELGPELGGAVGPEPEAESPGQPSRGRRASRRLSWQQRLVLAAVAGLLLGAGLAAGIRQLARSGAPVVVGTVQLRPLPQFPQWKKVSGRAVLQRSGSGTQLEVTLRAPARPGYYEVWLLGRDGRSMISLGDLSRSRSGVFTLPPHADLRFYSRIDISLQPFNGSTVHAPASVVRGRLP